MSVELWVKLNEPAQLGACLDGAAITLARLCDETPTPRIGHVIGEGELPDVHTILAPRAPDRYFTIAIEEEAEVVVMIDNFNPDYSPSMRSHLEQVEPSYRDEEGTWVIVEVGLRTEASFVLMMALVIAVARATRSPVRDDADLFRLGRFADPRLLLEQLCSAERAPSLQEAALLFCRSIGTGFGDG